MKNIYLLFTMLLAGNSLIYAPEIASSRKGKTALARIKRETRSSVSIADIKDLETKFKELQDEMQKMKKRKQTSKRWQGWLWLGTSLLSLFAAATVILVPLTMNMFMFAAAMPAIAISGIIVGATPPSGPELIMASLVTPIIISSIIICFSLYAFCKGCTLLAQGYGRRSRRIVLAS